MKGDAAAAAAGALLGLVLFGIAAAAGGVGHGAIVVYLVFFPYSGLAALVVDALGCTGGLVLAVAQYTFYGLLTSRCISGRLTPAVLLIAAALHVLAAAVVLSLAPY